MDMLESDALRSFAAFAEHRNFTTAAAALRVSQPSLHVKINNLARRLGVELYRREGRVLTLTEPGRRLAAFAEDSLRRVGDLVAELTQEQSLVRVAAGRGTLRWVISPAIRSIARKGGLQVITADRGAALAALTAGQADVAVVALDPPPPALRSRQIAAYPQMLVLPRGHRLATEPAVHLSDVDGMDLVVPPAGRPHRRALDRALGEAGVRWRVAAEVDGWDLLVHFADLGLGATLVNGCVRLPSGLCGVPVADLPEVRYWAAWRAQREAVLVNALRELGAA
jgi:LysR family transcriptional regulator, low CO2-responsive transcriptional regulator